MGKKRKPAHQGQQAGAPEDVNPADSRLLVRTFEDVADSEDEHFIHQDKIDFDDQPQTKRQKKLEREEEFLELSDEEILRDSEASEDGDDDHVELAQSTRKAPTGQRNSVEDSEEDEDEEKNREDERDLGWWGSSRKEYYDADQIETEADALEEEAEARRLQQKKLAKMSEADFMFDEVEWLGPTAEGETAPASILDTRITEDLTPDDRYTLMQARYPEFDYLVDEFQTLQPLLTITRQEAEGKPAKSLEVVKYWVLGSYVASLASYFAILTSPARDDDGAQRALNPAELRDHEIMNTLMTCRETWLKVEKLKHSKVVVAATGMLSPPEDVEETSVIEEVPIKDKVTRKVEKAAKKKAAEKAKRAQAVEDSLADLSELLKKPKKLAKAEAAPDTRSAARDDDNRSDFGEEDVMNAHVAADKAQRKKSLRFYTSQIVQKASRRADAGRDAGGDLDIPYRERLKDRQARLNAEAERRGHKDSKHGADLEQDNDGSDDGDEAEGGGRGEDDEYYDMVASASRQKKADRAAALAEAGRGERVVEQATVGADGKRRITYAIEKNRGLAPSSRRKKEARNPRVKKRAKYAEKQKKLRSMRPVYGGGEARGGYQGELSGIKTGLVKSVKF